MERLADPGSLFRTSFLDKGLVTYAECVAHYGALDADALLDEMRLLLTAPMLAVPFGIASARYYALMDALIRCAGRDILLSEPQRSKLIGICIDVGQFLRGRTPEGRIGTFDAALKGALDAIGAAPALPDVADQIRNGLNPAPVPIDDAEASLAQAAADMRALAFDEPPPALETAAVPA